MVRETSRVLDTANRKKKNREVYDLSEVFAEVFAGKSLEKSDRKIEN